MLELRHRHPAQGDAEVVDGAGLHDEFAFAIEREHVALA